jgi:tRNA A-37 threonylcarbamoyl transferase component Bud32
VVSPDDVPASIGRYRIESLIGRGGMGEVYRAFDPILNRTVALKTIRPGSTDPTLVNRLYREASACGRLRHPNIVTVYDLGEIDGLVFIAMEYLDGDPLGEAIGRGELTLEENVRIVIQILDAVHYAHSQGVIHRDVKPSNIHVRPGGEVKLLDFGIARVLRADSLTGTGDLIGTPFYMAPEQIKGQVVDHRADIYSAGVVAYELFTHRRAFDGTTLTEVMLKVLSDDPPPLDTGWSQTFPEIERIVLRAMSKHPDARYATAEDMKNAFAAFLSFSQAEIARQQAGVAVLARRTVAEAQVLLDRGQVAESLALLGATLRAHPEAVEVRRLHEQTMRAHPGIVSESPATVPASKRAAPVRDGDRREPPRPVDFESGSDNRVAGSSPTLASRLAWPAAAVVLLAIAAIAIAQLGFAPGADPPSAVAEPSRADGSRPSPPEDRQPGTTPASSGEPAPGSSLDDAGVPAAPPRPPGESRPAARQEAPQPRAAGASVSPASNTELSRALATRVGELLRARAIAPRDAVQVSLEMATRDAPFQAAAATTADWVATVRTAETTRALTGHVLGFSALALRNDVIERAAEAVVAFLSAGGAAPG